MGLSRWGGRWGSGKSRSGEAQLSQCTRAGGHSIEVTACCPPPPPRQNPKDGRVRGQGFEDANMGRLPGLSSWVLCASGPASKQDLWATA